MAFDMAKNPVVVWDHKRHLPIGRLLSAQAFDDRVEVVGEIFRFDDPVFAHWEEESLVPSTTIPSIKRTCDEVWALMLDGSVSSISWHGDSLLCQYVYSEQLDEFIPRHLQVTIKEVTITPIMAMSMFNQPITVAYSQPRSMSWPVASSPPMPPMSAAQLMSALAFVRLAVGNSSSTASASACQGLR